MSAILAEIGKIMGEGQPGQKVSETPISTNKKLGVVVYAYYHSCTEKTGSVAQVVEHLP
jgi:hypothetical protein